jgi:hypothetical protein
MEMPDEVRSAHVADAKKTNPHQSSFEDEQEQSKGYCGEISLERKFSISGADFESYSSTIMARQILDPYISYASRLHQKWIIA